jgi:hypothetical protein
MKEFGNVEIRALSSIAVETELDCSRLRKE